MELCRTALAFVICLFVPVQGQPCSCIGRCDNTKLVFPGSDGRIVDVAYGKPANMSSTYYSLQEGRSGPACMAINGKTDTVYRTLKTSKPNCVHTADGDINASWEVDLSRNYTVTNITIYRRKQNTERRMSGIHVEVDNQTCHTFPLMAVNVTALLALPEKIDMTCTPPLTGRVVRLQKRGQGFDYAYGAHFINVCEVQVWGCRDGLYGADCGEQCGQCAGSDTCSAVSGHCPHGCQPGWKGDNCKRECPSGSFGYDCSMQCTNCSQDRCHITDGECLEGCKPGYQWTSKDHFCNEFCHNGGYGKNCSEPCGQCRGGDQCDSFTGTCASCQPQFQPPFCKVCTGKRYGASCDLNCSTKCGGDGSCEQDTGRCVEGCAAGYRPGEKGFCNDVCEEGTYGEGCSMECGKCTHSCRHNDGLCIGGCFDGYAGPYCAQTSSPNLAGPVAGAVFGGLCVIALSILLVGLLIRRSKKRSSSETASPPPTSANQRFEPGAPVGLNGQAGLQETGSAGVAEAEESHIYDGLQTPDDSDRDPYSTPVFKGQQDKGRNSHTYQNPAWHSSDTGNGCYNL